MKVGLLRDPLPDQDPAQDDPEELAARKLADKAACLSEDPRTSRLLWQFIYFTARRSHNTARAYLSDYRAFFRGYKDPLAACTFAELASYIPLWIHLSERSLRRRLAALRSLFRYAHANRFIPANPAERLALEWVDPHEPEPPIALDTTPESRAWWEQAAQWNSLTFLMCRLAHEAKMSSKDLAELRWRDVLTLEDGRVALVTSVRGERYRLVALSPEMTERLLRLRRSYFPEPVLLWDDGSVSHSEGPGRASGAAGRPTTRAGCRRRRSSFPASVASG